MGQALYRKYRSRSLDELVGQEHITRTLAQAVKAGRISHAYLFTGPRGVGKTSVARILAHEINSLPYSDSPQLDIIEIDAASNRRIDDIRDLRDKVFIAPVSAKYKVYIIDEVHMLTGESFNALLKTLEEPPEHVVFILATTESHKLPATIISRTQRYAFRPGSREAVSKHLRSIAEKEDIKITDDALQLIADHGDGSFRDSVSLLDQAANVTEGEITAEDIANTLGLAPSEQLQNLIEALNKNDRTQIAELLNKLSSRGTNTSAIVAQLGKVLAEVAPSNPHLYKVIDNLLDVPRAYNPELKLLTVLMLACEPTPSQTAAQKSAPALATAQPPVVIAEAPAKPQPKKLVKKEEIEIPKSDKPLASLGPDEWHRVLAAIRKTSPPLYSVVKQAQPEFDPASQKLVLKFKYQLHRKKIDDVKAKSALASVIIATLGAAPNISTEIDAAATPPPPPPADPAAASVASIMGGGEVVDAPTT